MSHSGAERPLSPRLSIYRWRAPMLASLAHRVSGLVLVASVPMYLWFLEGLTGDEASFRHMLQVLHSPGGRLVLALVCLAWFYHLLNGIRFLFVDAGWLETRPAMRVSARIVLWSALVFALVIGGLL